MVEMTEIGPDEVFGRALDVLLFSRISRISRLIPDGAFERAGGFEALPPSSRSAALTLQFWPLRGAVRSESNVKVV